MLLPRRLFPQSRLFRVRRLTKGDEATNVCWHDQVDGVYNCDPMKNPDAVRLVALTYEDVQRQRLRIMDQTAITLCEENQIPVVVYNMYCAGHLARVLQGDVSVGTTVAADPCKCHEASPPVSTLAS